MKKPPIDREQRRAERQARKEARKAEREQRRAASKARAPHAPRVPQFFGARKFNARQEGTN